MGEQNDTAIHYFPECFSVFACFLVLPCVPLGGGGGLLQWDMCVLMCFSGYDVDDDVEWGWIVRQVGCWSASKCRWLDSQATSLLLLLVSPAPPPYDQNALFQSVSPVLLLSHVTGIVGWSVSMRKNKTTIGCMWLAATSLLCLVRPVIWSFSTDSIENWTITGCQWSKFLT